jgi:hypothetical protein
MPQNDRALNMSNDAFSDAKRRMEEDFRRADALGRLAAAKYQCEEEFLSSIRLWSIVLVLCAIVFGGASICAALLHLIFNAGT